MCAEDPSPCPVSLSPPPSKLHTQDSTVTQQDFPPASPSQTVRHQPLLTEAHNINSDILRSGVLCLPGTVHMCEINTKLLCVTDTRVGVRRYVTCTKSGVLRPIDTKKMYILIHLFYKRKLIVRPLQI